MNRRDFIVGSIAIIPIVTLLKGETLHPWFKYFGNGIYSCKYPSFPLSDKKAVTMMSTHSTRLNWEQAHSKEFIRQSRIKTMIENRIRLSKYRKKEYDIVYYEKSIYDIDLNNGFISPHWTNHCYNSARFALVERKELEKAVWK